MRGGHVRSKVALTKVSQSKLNANLNCGSHFCHGEARGNKDFNGQLESSKQPRIEAKTIRKRMKHAPKPLDKTAHVTSSSYRPKAANLTIASIAYRIWEERSVEHECRSVSSLRLPDEARYRETSSRGLRCQACNAERDAHWLKRERERESSCSNGFETSQLNELKHGIGRSAFLRSGSKHNQPRVASKLIYYCKRTF